MSRVQNRQRIEPKPLCLTTTYEAKITDFFLAETCLTSESTYEHPGLSNHKTELVCIACARKAVTATSSLLPLCRLVGLIPNHNHHRDLHLLWLSLSHQHSNNKLPAYGVFISFNLSITAWHNIARSLPKEPSHCENVLTAPSPSQQAQNLGRRFLSPGMINTSAWSLSLRQFSCG